MISFAADGSFLLRSATWIGSPCARACSDVRLVKADALLRQRVNQLLIHAIGGAQMKLALQIVEDIDRASLGAGELHRLGDDGGEHGLEIERRVHCLRHFAERAQLADRAAKLIGALAQCVQKSGILDGDRCLVGEGLDQRDLLVREGPDLQAINRRSLPSQVVAFEHRHSQNCPDSVRRPLLRSRVFWISQTIGDVNRSAFNDGTIHDSAVSAWTDRSSFNELHEFSAKR